MTDHEPEPTPDHIPPAPLRGSSLWLVQRDIAWREVETLNAEVERLKADRTALLGLLISKIAGRWLVWNTALSRSTYPTREAAEEAVLAWARGRQR